MSWSRVRCEHFGAWPQISKCQRVEIQIQCAVTASGQLPDVQPKCKVENRYRRVCNESCTEGVCALHECTCREVVLGPRFDVKWHEAKEWNSDPWSGADLSCCRFDPEVESEIEMCTNWKRLSKRLFTKLHEGCVRVTWVTRREVCTCDANARFECQKTYVSVKMYTWKSARIEILPCVRIGCGRVCTKEFGDFDPEVESKSGCNDVHVLRKVVFCTPRCHQFWTVVGHRFRSATVGCARYDSKRPWNHEKCVRMCHQKTLSKSTNAQTENRYRSVCLQSCTKGVCALHEYTTRGGARTEVWHRMTRVQDETRARMSVPSDVNLRWPWMNRGWHLESGSGLPKDGWSSSSEFTGWGWHSCSRADLLDEIGDEVGTCVQMCTFENGYRSVYNESCTRVRAALYVCTLLHRRKRPLLCSGVGRFRPLSPRL